MIRAYDLVYLDSAQENLAVLFDYSINYLGIPLQYFYKRFLESTISMKFERGDYTVLAGKSGIELSKDLLGDSFRKVDYQPEGRSPEYWLGYSLAYLNWKTNLSFKKLNTYLKIHELISMYHPYHEMSENRFVERVIEIYNERKHYTNLQIIRTSLGSSRRVLSLISGVPERTIEQYEQRRKSINKANAEYVVALARALKCSVEDLLEIDIEQNNS